MCITVSLDKKVVFYYNIYVRNLTERKDLEYARQRKHYVKVQTGKRQS